MIDSLYFLNKVASIVDPDRELTTDEIIEKIESKFTNKTNVLNEDDAIQWLS